MFLQIFVFLLGLNSNASYNNSGSSQGTVDVHEIESRGNACHCLAQQGGVCWLVHPQWGFPREPIMQVGVGSALRASVRIVTSGVR